MVEKNNSRKEKRMITITKIFEFSAGHHLPNHEGVCKRPHGHNYKLEITVALNGKAPPYHLRTTTTRQFVHKVGPESGMVIDFKTLKDIIKEEVLSDYDHVVFYMHLRGLVNGDLPRTQKSLLWLSFFSPFYYYFFPPFS